MAIVRLPSCHNCPLFSILFWQGFSGGGQDEKTSNEFKERAITWMHEQNPKFFSWAVGDVSLVKGAFYNKKEQHSEALPDGLVVPILCEKCGNVLAHYDELPEPPM